MAPAVDKKCNFESERLALPKATVSYDKEGRPVYGFLKAPARRQLGRHFEEAKAIANREAEEKLMRPPSGTRIAARDAFYAECARREDKAHQRKTPRPAPEFYLRTSADFPLDGPVKAPMGNAHRQSLRTYDQEELPLSIRTHFTPYMAPTPVERAREELQSREQARQSQAVLDKVKEVREFGRRTCQEYPHGLTKLGLAKLSASSKGMLNMADIPALSLQYAASTSTLH